MSDFLERRKRLVFSLKAEGVIKSPKVERAFLKVPREEFVLPEYKQYAYDDSPLPILKDQTISAPHMCAIMCEALELRRGDLVLEVGTGSGYHGALCAEIVSPSEEALEGRVLSLEYHKELAIFANNNLKRTRYDDRIDIIVCDGSMGAPVRDDYRFTKILVTAAAPSIPKSLMDQLMERGRLVIPIGKYLQRLVLAEKEEGKVRIKELGGCLFVRMRGRLGFKDREN